MLSTSSHVCSQERERERERESRWQSGRAYKLEDLVAIHASPPCQHYTPYGNVVKDIKERYEDLIVPTRALLSKTGLPYVIENVERARSVLINPIKLCGSMFNGDGTNDIQRHRMFEANWPLTCSLSCDHKMFAPNRYPGGRSTSRGGHSKALVRNTIEIGAWDIPLEKQKWAMGVDWPITVRELSEAIPPAYTRFVGRQLSEYLHA
jgi:DNA (cytosine-5)-methyltransferase 1